MELKMPVKLAYKLKHRTLFPGSLERQSVQLTHAVFHDSTVEALRFYGKRGKPNYHDTAEFLSVILQWWKTVNTKSLFTATHKRDPDREVISKENCVDKTSFLRGFVDWLSDWEVFSGTKYGLSSETFSAAKHSTACLADLAEHLIEEEQFSYVLLGKFQSDPLEGRFGAYRQMNGGNMYASVKQIIESERCLKIKNLAKLKLSLSEIKNIFSSAKFSHDSKLEELSTHISNCIDTECDTYPEIQDADKNILFYVAGSFATKMCAAKKCESCTNLIISHNAEGHILSGSQEYSDENEHDKGNGKSLKNNNKRSYLDQVDRGGLTIPSETFFLICAQIWNFYATIMKEDHLKEVLYSENNCSRTIFTKAFLKFMDRNEETRLLFLVPICDNGHSLCEIVSGVAEKLFNLFSKNHSLVMNSSIHQSKRKKSSEGSDTVKRDLVKIKVAKLQSDSLS